jgi:hypothetical protein
MATAGSFLKGFVDTYAGMNRGDIKGKLYIREQLRQDMLDAQKAREGRNMDEYHNIMAEAAQQRAIQDEMNNQNSQNWRVSSLNETIRHNKAAEGAAGSKEIYDASLDGFVDPNSKTFTPLKNAPPKPSNQMKEYDNAMELAKNLAYQSDKSNFGTLSPDQRNQWIKFIQNQLSSGIAPIDVKRPVITPAKDKPGWFTGNYPAETSFVVQQPTQTTAKGGSEDAQKAALRAKYKQLGLTDEEIDQEFYGQ